MARRILNRKELRADFDAAERRKDGDEEEVEDAADDTEEDEEEEAKAEEDEEGGEEEEDEDAEEKPKKKKAAPKAAKPKAKAKPRSRSVKVTRMRVVWGVFNNSNQCVATYEYPKRKDADAHAAKLTADKKNTHFVQPIKEPMEVKKEE
jgi:cobalamin biosynthesis protein CobT